MGQPQEKPQLLKAEQPYLRSFHVFFFLLWIGFLMIAVADIDFSLIDSERAKMPIAKDSYYMEIGKEEDK
nr:hypothetical protein CFP56_31215 [Quercus suber]